jgi:putative transposase
VIVDYIESHKNRFGVEPIVEVLNEHGVTIALSTYYEHAARGFGPTEAELEDAYAANEVHRQWTANRRLYGQHKLWKTTVRAGGVTGVQRGRDQVARLMRIAAIRGVVRGKRATITTRPEPSAPRHPDHVNRAWDSPTRPDQWWVADFSYVWTLAGFVYVSFVTDVYSRRILGWRVSTSKTTPLVLSALEQAIFTRRRGHLDHGFEFITEGLVHHSDAGSQYTSLAFTEELLEAGITGSIGTVGDALDNALMESTIGLFKTEVIEHEKPTGRSWAGRAEVEKATASWVHWYNATRLHTSIGDVPPIEYEEAYHHRTHGSRDDYAETAVA